MITLTELIPHYKYKGFNDCDSHCELRIYREDNNPIPSNMNDWYTIQCMYYILIENRNNFGTAISNFISPLIKEIYIKYHKSPMTKGRFFDYIRPLQQYSEHMPKHLYDPMSELNEIILDDNQLIPIGTRGTVLLSQWRPRYERKIFDISLLEDIIEDKLPL